jgi:hypothetical protein
MNFVNCSQYFGTDHLFEDVPSETCDSPIVAVALINGTIIISKTFASIYKWRRYFQRKEQNLRADLKGPLLASFLTLCYILFLIFFLTDTINVTNGLSFALYTVSYLFFAASFTLYLVRMVRLGTRIATVSKDLEHSPVLEKFDRFGYIFVGCAAVALTVTSVILVIVGPIHPESYVLYGSIGWASKGLFQLFITLALIWQIQRCYLAIQKQMPESKKKTVVLARLRRNQWHVFLGLTVAVYYIVLSTRVIFWYW